MKSFRKIFIILFLLIGIVAVYLGFNVSLECTEAMMRDNLLAGLPLIIFGAYSLITALFLWKKFLIGQTLAVLGVLMALILILAPIFNLSIPIIQTSCT